MTCGDVAVPMRVLAIDARRDLALCADEAGRRHTVEIALVDSVSPGAELLVHAGTAITALQEEASSTGPVTPGCEAEEVLR